MERYERRPKPVELTVLYGVAGDLFVLLRDTYDIPEVIELELHHVDAHALETRTVAAIAMRDAQLLREAARRGEPVTNVEVVRIAASIDYGIELLVDSGHDDCPSAELLQARNRINEAGRVATWLGTDVDGGIVELE